MARTGCAILCDVNNIFVSAHNVGEDAAAYLDDNNVVQPDVVFVSTQNFGILTDDGMHGAPDLALTQALVETITVVVFCIARAAMVWPVLLEHDVNPWWFLAIDVGTSPTYGLGQAMGVSVAGELYDRFSPSLLAVALRMLGSAREAESWRSTSARTGLRVFSVFHARSDMCCCIMARRPALIISLTSMPSFETAGRSRILA